MHGLSIFLTSFIAASIFLVWGVQHTSIANELKQAKLPNCRLPNWLRDFLAILKITGAILLLVGVNRPRAAICGGLMTAILMAFAAYTHFRMPNPPPKMVLAAMILVCSLVVAYLNYRLNFSL